MAPRGPRLAAEAADEGQSDGWAIRSPSLVAKYSKNCIVGARGETVTCRVFTSKVLMAPAMKSGVRTTEAAARQVWGSELQCRAPRLTPCPQRTFAKTAARSPHRPGLAWTSNLGLQNTWLQYKVGDASLASQRCPRTTHTRWRPWHAATREEQVSRHGMRRSAAATPVVQSRRVIVARTCERTRSNHLIKRSTLGPACAWRR